jgi:hypothetical protein
MQAAAREIGGIAQECTIGHCAQIRIDGTATAGRASDKYTVLDNVIRPHPNPTPRFVGGCNSIGDREAAQGTPGIRHHPKATRCLTPIHKSTRCSVCATDDEVSTDRDFISKNKNSVCNHHGSPAGRRINGGLYVRGRRIPVGEWVLMMAEK